jgi:amino acid adenylation domain-containing protein
MSRGCLGGVSRDLLERTVGAGWGGERPEDRRLELATEHFGSFVEVARARAAAEGARCAYTFLADGGEEAATLTFAELDLRARAIAADLTARLRRLGRQGLPAGERALLLFPAGLDFVAAFLGCLYAGVVAVPCGAPRPGRGSGRLAALLRDARPRLALTTAALAPRVRLALGGDSDGLAGEVEILATDLVPGDFAGEWRPPVLGLDSIAFLQYTSGSTSEPRGVVVTHGNLLANERAIAHAFGQSRDSVVVSWLPLDHDMGLIGGALQPLWSGGRAVLLSPLAFLSRPRLWLEAVSRFRATTSGGPDFAYALAARRIPVAERAGLDLASWEVAFNGAEPVRAATLERFAEAFGPCGFRREAFVPCYGLAEATLLVSGGRSAEAPRVRADPAEDGAAEAVGDTARVGCGRAWPGEELRVVDPATALPLPVGRVGEIWVAGPSVAAGYWGRPEESAATFGARLASEDGGGGGTYLRTGDLGFLDEAGELFVTGRQKDLLVLRGRNVYPQDVEAVAEAGHPALRLGGAAAFGVEVEGEERLVVVVEVERRREAEAGAAAAAVAERVVAELDVAAHAVVPVRAGGIPRTTSGKVRRGACRAAFLGGALAALGTVPRSVGLEEGGQGEAFAERSLGGEVAVAASGESGPGERGAGPLAGGRNAAGEPVRSAGTVALPRPDLLPELFAAVRERAARVLRLDPLRLDLDRAMPLDSLQAVELRNRLEEDCGAAPPLEALLTGISPRQAGVALAGSLAEPGDSALPTAVGRPEGTPILPVEGELLSHGQRALWLLHRLAPASPVHNLALAARLRRPGGAPPGPDAVRLALEALVARHAALRTLMAATADGPRPRAVGGDEVAEVLDFAVVDGLTEPLSAWLSDQAHLPFDLARGPLVRARYVATEGEPVLLFATHHVAADFWSLELLLADLGGLLAGEPGPAPAAGYSDFVRWQGDLLAERGARLWEQWRGALAGFDEEPLGLPADRPRPPARSGRGIGRPIALPVGVSEGVAALASACGASRFAVLLAACQALLGRLSGRDDLLLGVPAAGRGQARFEDVVGYFVNLLPLRADLSGEPTFVELVRRARLGLAAAVSRQDLPFPVLVERLRPRREPGLAPLVQAVLAWEQPRSPERGDLAALAVGRGEGEVPLPGGTVLVPLTLERRTSELDLEIALGEVAGRLAGRLTVDADLFDGVTAVRFADQLERLVAAAVAEPGLALGDLPLLAPAERAQVLVEWNGGGAPVPAGCLHEAVFRWARQTPLAVAVLEGERTLTYGELARRASRLARRLRALGAGPEAPVALHLGRSAAQIVGQIAALAAGAPFVPLDPEHPAAHLGFLIADSGAAVRVTSAELAGVLDGGAPGASASVIPTVVLTPGGENLDLGADTADVRAELASARVGEEAEADLIPVDPEQAAYVIYTSGSTGRPKGVACTHRAVLNLLADFAGRAPLAPGDRCSWWASPGFDASVYEVYSALSAGAAVLPVPAAVRLDGPRHIAWMAAAGVRCAYVPPFQVGDLAAAVAAGAPVPPLTRLLVGVEPLPERQLAAIAAALPERFLLNGYGPTEATVCATLHRVDADGGRAGGEGRAPIGRPLRNVQVRLLDAAGRPVPAGVAGELWIGGLAVGLGYWRDPVRTALGFRPDPFAGLAAGIGGGGEPGARLYRSGDRARWLSGGVIEFLGRVDRQVKVRGVRLEPAAVEAALREHPGVREAAVDKRGDRLVAWVSGVAEVVAGGAPGVNGAPDAAALRAHLAARLPSAMVPSVFVALPALPLTVHGKLDRRALPDPPPPALSGAAPRTELERRLAALFAEVLGVERVGVDQSFFELGGHSLQLAKVHARLSAELDREIPMTDLFHHPTIAGLAAHLAQEARGAAGAAGVAGVAGADNPAAGAVPAAAVAAVRERAAARRAAGRRGTR